jgi:hypothetical protein
MSVVRGCGVRQAGGIYLRVATSPNGRPIEDFLVDPPVIIHPSEIGLTPVGVRGIEDASGVYHVFDWVGVEHYPKVLDAIEEGRRYGFSRRAEGSGIDYSRLTSRSSLVLVHSKAAFVNAADFGLNLRREGRTWRCPNRLTFAAAAGEPRMIETIARHDPANNVQVETCLGMHHHDYAASEVVQDAGVAAWRMFPPKNPQWRYDVWTRPEGFTPRYAVAIFAQLPLGGVEVVRDPANQDRERSQYHKASTAQIDVRLVSE